MVNKFRLTSPMFERELEADKIRASKIFFLSVEGNLTEKEYFEKISAYRTQLGINAKVNIEVLCRSMSDTNSAPVHVIELLEEYVNDVRGLTNDDIIDKISPLFKSKYSKEFIKEYLENPSNLPEEKKEEFLSELLLMGYDLNYIKYLSQYNGEDEFGIVIDRDSSTHSEKNMKDCIEHCKEKNYLCFVSNPCFEFWLMMHLCDVKEKYGDNLHDIECNAKVSKNHTFVSKEVWSFTGHGKAHLNFEKNYLNNVTYAIKQSKTFETEVDRLINNIGTNIGSLIERMMERPC